MTDRDTQKQTRHEHLKLYVYEKPKTEKTHNKEPKIPGENIRAKRQLDLQAGNYGFVTSRIKQKSFIEFFRKITESKKVLAFMALIISINWRNLPRRQDE